MTQDSERRYRTVHLSTEVIARILGQGTVESRAVERVPDLRIIAIRYEHWMDRIEVLVASEQFEPVPESQVPPIWEPHFTTHTMAAA